jgi:REP element-mobilizing transposase RayT
MPRPLRIEYNNAFYHVMNRGRGRAMIFHDKRYYLAFLETLSEVHSRFNCIIHAYCLMGNHYHLLIETPDANLSRIMRHINGVYTQRYNRLKKTDGSLFRGRFKAILVDKDEYIMQLSRYIHRNPIETNKPLVAKLSDYSWSSYPAFINSEKPPTWLYREFTYEVLGHESKYKAYKNFVEQDNDSEIVETYSKKHLPSILGTKAFKEMVFNKMLGDKSSEQKSKIINPKISMSDIVEIIAKHYGVKVSDILKKTFGRQSSFEARKVAMYLCQELTDKYLREIMHYFNLNHIGSVSYNSSKIRQKKKENKQFSRRLERIIDKIVKQVI